MICLEIIALEGQAFQMIRFNFKFFIRLQMFEENFLEKIVFESKEGMPISERLRNLILTFEKVF